MSWFGSPSLAGIMWSIVQSPPTNSLEQITQQGSRTVLAYALAFAQSVELCQSAIFLFHSSPYMGLAYYFYRDALLNTLDKSIVITPRSFRSAMMNDTKPVIINTIASNGRL